jgi:hypothetical protein
MWNVIKGRGRNRTIADISLGSNEKLVVSTEA